MLVSACLLSSCRKYEDGPTFTLRSKKERVINNWASPSVVRNDINETNFYFVYGMEFKRNGQWVWRIDRNDDTLALAERTGRWKLTAANTQIEITYDEIDPSNSEELLFLKLRRLTEDEMWVNFIYREDTYNIQFE
jgi:hypothetical protein